MSTLQPNTLLQGGKYKIIKVLGQGGFGITYLAMQSGLERKVAVKEFFMKELCSRDGSTSRVTIGTEGSRETVSRFREKFLKEARNIARLNHSNIVRVIDVFEENGTAYYVMKYAENGSLAEKVKKQGYLPEPLATRYIIQIASALEYIHKQKMNHLDVKPANIMLNEKDEAVLIDFGLSKQYDATTGNQTSTTPVGISEGYAPMEQYMQGGVGVFSPETDVYALGATFFKLLTGMTPPDASFINNNGVPVEELRAKGLSQAVVDVICKAMESRKKDRLHDISSFMKLLGSQGSTIAEKTKPMPTDDDTLLRGKPQPKPAPEPKPTANKAGVKDNPQMKPASTTRSKPKPKNHRKLILGLAISGMVVAAISVILLKWLGNNTWEIIYDEGQLVEGEAYEGKNVLGSVLSFKLLSEDQKTLEVHESTSRTYSIDMDIPSKVTFGDIEYTVVSIGDSAFIGCDCMTSVTIPISVTSIGNWAFRGCSDLSSVSIPNSVTSIGDGAFYYCIDLTSIKIPDSVTSIGVDAFCGCNDLTSIKVAAGNTVYDSRENCNAIIETSSNELVVGCKNTVFPNSVTSIGNHAFDGCSDLTSITIPNSVTSIGNSAFKCCDDLNSVKIGNSVTSIGDSAFYWCLDLKSVAIPNSVTSIGNSAFESCDSLPSVKIGNSVTSIGDCAFFGCSGLTSITIPSSVTSIGKCVFNGCQGLTSIIVDSNNKYLDSRENCNAIIEKSTNKLIMGFKNSHIPNSVTSIGPAAFAGKPDLTSITIPNSVTRIEENAFYNCSGLTSITIPNSVTTIGNWAFGDCRNLKEIHIMNPSTEIGEDAFQGCHRDLKILIGK